MEGNELVFDRSQYEEDCKMWDDISTVIRILTKNNYISVFKYDDCGYYWLRWVSAKEELGGPVVRFLDNNEVEVLEYYRFEKQLDDEDDDFYGNDIPCGNVEGL